jgi:hypothetical protein
MRIIGFSIFSRNKSNLNVFDSGEVGLNPPFGNFKEIIREFLSQVLGHGLVFSRLEIIFLQNLKNINKHFIAYIKFIQSINVNKDIFSLFIFIKGMDLASDKHLNVPYSPHSVFIN